VTDAQGSANGLGTNQAIVRDQSHTVSLGRQLALARRAAETCGPLTLGARRAHLAAIERIVKSHAAALADAIGTDFGQRSPHETRLIEIFPTLAAARYARRHLAAWMAPQRAPVAPYFWPAHARVVPQPVGVGGIIAPWNYPCSWRSGRSSARSPRGNRAMLKMPDLSPHTGELLAPIIRSEFAADHVTAVSGRPARPDALSAQLLGSGVTTMYGVMRRKQLWRA